MSKDKIQYGIRKGKFGDEIYLKDIKQGGYTGYFNDFPQMVTQGETIKEAQNRLWNIAYDTLKFLLHDKLKQ